MTIYYYDTKGQNLKLLNLKGKQSFNSWQTGLSMITNASKR